uniref:RAB29, member RAS onco family n=1 Tax=Callorhinchus milii TaxID=7868 RepID=A0A4W3GK31_CALMI
YVNASYLDFALKILEWSDTETVRLQLWDIAGQERFTSMTRLYYRQAGACIIMFDVTNVTTFWNCLKWKHDLDGKVTLMDGSPVPCVLLANKSDLAEWAVTKEEIERFSKQNHFVGWIETSVKENKNINRAMRYIVSRGVLDIEMLHISPPGKLVPFCFDSRMKRLFILNKSLNWSAGWTVSTRTFSSGLPC